jgi:hypothetical protein
MTKEQRKAEAILRHVFQLQRIFPAAANIGARGPKTLYARLHRIEAEAHHFAERECNEQLPEGASERKTASILKRLDALLGFKALGIPVFVNGDPRGYALKIDDAYVKAHNLEIHRDWGGYGILCPDF